MKVLILGGTGFIGSNLFRNFSQKKLFSKITLTSNKQNKEKNALQLDILNKERLETLVKNQEVIINLTGKSGVVATLKDPVETFKVNTIGQLNLLEACKKVNPKALIIFVTSRLEYGKPARLPVRSSDPLKPNSIYGMSKYAATVSTLIYHRLYNLKTVVLRISNPFGSQPLPTSFSYNLINHFIYQAVKDGTITIFGKGEQKRDYIYIDDVCQVFYKVIINKKKIIGRVFNIGSGRPISLQKMAKLIIKTAGKGRLEYKSWPKEWRSLETGDFYFDISRAKKILSWEPETTIQKGIIKTIKDFSYEHR